MAPQSTHGGKDSNNSSGNNINELCDISSIPICGELFGGGSCNTMFGMKNPFDNNNDDDNNDQGVTNRTAEHNEDQKPKEAVMSESKNNDESDDDSSLEQRETMNNEYERATTPKNSPKSPKRLFAKLGRKRANTTGAANDSVSHNNLTQSIPTAAKFGGRNRATSEGNFSANANMTDSPKRSPSLRFGKGKLIKAAGAKAKNLKMPMFGKKKSDANGDEDDGKTHSNNNETSEGEDDDDDDQKEQEAVSFEEDQKRAGNEMTATTSSSTSNDATEETTVSSTTTPPPSPRRKSSKKKGSKSCLSPTNSPKKSPKRKKKSIKTGVAKGVEEDEKTNPFAIDCVDGEDNEGADDVHKLLDNIKIEDDMDDFDIDSMPMINEGTVAAIDFTKIDWDKRLKREEIYSKRYKTSKEETAELQALADVLGISAPNTTGSLFQGLRTSVSVAIGIESTDDTETMNKLLFSGHSILLKCHCRGQDVTTKQKKRLRLNDKQNNENHKFVELVLLTDGFILALPDYNRLNPLETRYESCHLWSQVDYCQKINKSKFVIQLLPTTPTSSTSNVEDDDGKKEDAKPDTPTRYELEMVVLDSTDGDNDKNKRRASKKDDDDDVKSWFKAIERIFIEHSMHTGRSEDSLGWQYRLIRTSGYSAAVVGDPTIVGKPKNLNKLDTYNRMAPLHYVLQQEDPNVDVVKALLSKGADPNFVDEDGRSAMYYGKCEYRLILLPVVPAAAAVIDRVDQKYV